MMRYPPSATLGRVVALLAVILAAGTAAPDASHGPERIVSCAPNLTEIAFDIGAGPRVVGVDRYSTHPAEAAALPRVGDLFAPDLERMLALRPEAILLVPSNAKVREFFARRGVRLVECGDANTVASILETYAQLGRELGCEEGAARAARRITAVFDFIDRRVAEAPPRTPPAALVLLRRLPGSFNDLFAVSERTYIGEMVARLGFRNVVPDSMPYWAQVSLENVLAWNPETIVEIQESGEPPGARRERLRADWLRFESMRAPKRPEGIVVVDGRRMNIPGPAIGPAFADVARALRPDLFSGMMPDDIVRLALQAAGIGETPAAQRGKKEGP